MDEHRERPITIAMLALGGQGGGVLTGWLVETAEANGYLAQSTYVAGVAQRTGAIVYCVEMFPRDRKFLFFEHFMNQNVIRFKLKRKYNNLQKLISLIDYF